MIPMEQRETQMMRDREMIHPADFGSIIVDGVDKSAFGLPHFMVTENKVHIRPPKLMIVGPLEHCDTKTS